MKDWVAQEACATAANILTGSFVDAAHREKSRCAREFVTHQDPNVFAAASDVDNTSLIDLFDVRHKRPHLVLRRGCDILPGSRNRVGLHSGFLRTCAGSWPRHPLAVPEGSWQDHLTDKILRKDWLPTTLCPSSERKSEEEHIKDLLRTPAIFLAARCCKRS